MYFLELQFDETYLSRPDLLNVISGLESDKRKKKLENSTPTSELSKNRVTRPDQAAAWVAGQRPASNVDASFHIVSHKRRENQFLGCKCRRKFSSDVITSFPESLFFPRRTNFPQKGAHFLIRFIL